MLIFSLFKKYVSTITLSDSELISKYKETDASVYFAELYKRHTRFCFLVCMKYLKDDENSKEAVLQIFEKLLSDIKRHEIVNFKPWLHTVTKNHCLHIIRDQSYKLKREKELKKDYETFMESDEVLYHANEIDKEEMIVKLEYGMIKLKDEQRLCIELFYLQDKCYEEVAEVTGFTMNEVKSYIQNGKRNLKLLLTGQK
ncbi:MAG TPA: RNA polymerase subunit sigma-24 [Bacteroidales bacterium]|nr:MAG: hypothetical protein A2W98_04305 [Bacteroidetes bacterium GWF2_33_38]OFY91528.1 MAG: hypothetical protein A2236_01170 [Bacteroidetes bacterium RIFOXYA2_FULL_33_7]HBF88441.1 RNA polymerase subunit sigma-24 [Bacteroidales bacterium]